MQSFTDFTLKSDQLVASKQENPFPKIRFVCFTGSLLCLIKFQIQKGAKSAV